MLSIVTPAFNEEKSLPILHKKLIEVMEQTDTEWEWIIVDDHSVDNTENVIQEMVAKDERIRTFRLSKNFGAWAAMKCGIDKARGDCLVNMAADMQNPPEKIPELLQQWKNRIQVLWGLREKREGEPLTVTLPAKLYHWIFRKTTFMKNMPDQFGDYYMIDRVVIEAIKQFKEYNLSIIYTLVWMGFRCEYFTFVRKPRIHGSSGWSFSKKIIAMIDSLLLYSYFPIRFISYSGIFVSILGFLFAFRIIFKAILGYAQFEMGWPSLMVVMLLLSGFQMIMLGIVGEYLWRTNYEVKKRPQYLVEKQIDSQIGVSQENREA